MGFIVICIFILVLLLGFTTVWRYSVSTFVGAILAFVYKIVDSQGQKIPGPSWEWPHGQFVDKFIDGRSKSSLWYGVLTSSIDVKEFYSDARVHEKSRSSNGGWYFHQILGDCLGLINGSRHRRLRNIFESHFTRRAVANRCSHMNDYSLSFLQSIPPTEGNESSVLHASSAFMKYPLLCTAEIIYGPMEEGERNELWEIGPGRLNLMRYVLSYRSFCTGITAIYELSNFKRRWKDFNAKMAEKRGNSLPLTPIVTSWQSIERKEVTENEVKLHPKNVAN
ncbi:putative cytochrome p450 oxidoreductase protein [Botrytis fragariae]|uniref:Putative cytochrome p450 oxidoreductase protein n=1 Tax=Botrytis fragariae TaxID=1964551 RepID=A0A8H6ED64_9HELO|nr:putative cytochrome p450 oxidoreductase protein [Botrytis fragariae]KAF5867495.1 putative cytochrome p450 oxidoreductase protein [Botrytis fragariae]